MTVPDPSLTAAWMADNRLVPPRASLSPSAPAVEGLRERKKRRTRLTIQSVALELFQRQGFEETTIEQIAAAADISPSTFFNYFPSKEDVVAFDEYDPLVLGDLASRPPSETTIEKLRHVMVEVTVPLVERDRDLVLARMRVMLNEPSLRARLWQETDQSIETLARMLAPGAGTDPGDYELRVIVRMATSAAFEALVEWARHDGKPNLRKLLTRALGVVERGAQAQERRP